MLNFWGKMVMEDGRRQKTGTEDVYYEILPLSSFWGVVDFVLLYTLAAISYGRAGLHRYTVKNNDARRASGALIRHWWCVH